MYSNSKGFSLGFQGMLIEETDLSPVFPFPGGVLVVRRRGCVEKHLSATEWVDFLFTSVMRPAM